MKKVMVFGTFDLLHEGHRYFLQEAKKYGNFLIVVIARDSSVRKMKGVDPHQNELQRLEQVKKIFAVDKVVLGNEDDFYKVIEEYQPHILCFGYDQNKLNVESELKKRKIRAELYTLSAFAPEKYKSTLIRKQLKK